MPGIGSGKSGGQFLMSGIAAGSCRLRFPACREQTRKSGFGVRTSRKREKMGGFEVPARV
jgi:hypothetical protein